MLLQRTPGEPMKKRAKVSGARAKAQGPRAAKLNRHDVPKAATRFQSLPSGKEKEVARLTRELSEARELKTAASEVLQVISSSRGDLQPVFAAMLEKAVRLCDASFGNIYRWDGEVLHIVASQNTPRALAEFRLNSPLRPGPNSITRRALIEKTTIQVADIAAEPEYRELREANCVAAVELGGVRTLMIVPLLKSEELIGLFILFRQQARPFTGEQIGLIQDFASQAVIAIENTRLLNELRQSLEQQTASSEVLKVISSSPGDLESAFESVLANATRLCEATFGTLALHEGGGRRFRLVGLHNAPAAFAEVSRREPVIELGPGSPLVRATATKATIQVADYTETETYKRR